MIRTGHTPGREPETSPPREGPVLPVCYPEIEPDRSPAGAVLIVVVILAGITFAALAGLALVAAAAGLAAELTQ